MSSILAMTCLSASALGWGWETGHLIVTFTDKETGGPITNATVTVRTLTQTGIGAGAYESHYTKTSAMTDSNGVADVQFRFNNPDFRWWVSAPSHYRREFGIKKECFRANIVPSDYENIDPFAPDHAAKEQEMKAIIESGDWQSLQQKLEPKSVTYEDKVIRRSVSFYPKHNPQPMYSYGGSPMDCIYLPYESGCVTNGVELYGCPEVDVDLEQCSLLPPYEKLNKPHLPGKVSDFKLVRNNVIITNGIRRFSGYIQFAPGCGAYKRPKTGDDSFPTAYIADTNEVFASRIEFLADWSNVSNVVVSSTPLLRNDEYMVVRTRANYDEIGSSTNYCYSKIWGIVPGVDRLKIQQIIFNPRPNDPNLEYDFNNLAGSRGGNRWP